MPGNYDILRNSPMSVAYGEPARPVGPEAQRKIQEFAERSENEFLVIDLLSEEPVPSNLPPRNSLEIAKRNKSIA